jgi:hypothetical protein
MVFLYALVFLVILALVFGYINSEEMTIGFEVNTLRTQFYKLGVVSQRYTLEDGSVEDELVIGLFFVNVVIVFWKPNEE